MCGCNSVMTGRNVLKQHHLCQAPGSLGVNTKVILHKQVSKRNWLFRRVVRRLRSRRFLHEFIEGSQQVLSRSCSQCDSPNGTTLSWMYLRTAVHAYFLYIVQDWFQTPFHTSNSRSIASAWAPADGNGHSYPTVANRHSFSV